MPPPCLVVSAAPRLSGAGAVHGTGERLLSAPDALAMENVLNQQTEEGWELVTSFQRTHKALQVGSTTVYVPGLVSTVLVFKKADYGEDRADFRLGRKIWIAVECRPADCWVGAAANPVAPGDGPGDRRVARLRSA